MHLEQAYRQYRRRLIGLAKCLVKSQVASEDLVHEAFAHTLARIRSGKMRDESNLYPYLRKWVRLTARGVKYQEPIAEPVELPHKPSALTRLAVADAWEELTPQERIAIARLHILEEDLSRLDQNVYASRIRVARRRLGSAA